MNSDVIKFTRLSIHYAWLWRVSEIRWLIILRNSKLLISEWSQYKIVSDLKIVAMKLLVPIIDYI